MEVARVRLRLIWMVTSSEVFFPLKRMLDKFQLFRKPSARPKIVDRLVLCNALYQISERGEKRVREREHIPLCLQGLRVSSTACLVPSRAL